MQFATYKDARAHAQERADHNHERGLKWDQSAMGLEKAPMLNERTPWRVFGPLPAPKSRQGHELRCEAVLPMINREL